MTKKGYNQQLRELNPAQQMLFCTALAERMLPNYQYVVETEDAEAAQKSRAIMDTLWEKLSVSHAKIDFTKQAEKLQELMPDVDESASLGAYLALDALLAVDIAIQHVIQADPESAMSIARLSRASVSRFIECTEELTQAISRHPLMQFEHETQNELLEMLMHTDKVSPALVREVKTMLRESGVSNIGLERD